MKTFKNLLLAFLAVFVVLGLAACSSNTSSKTSSNTWEKIQQEKNKTITIGFDNTFVPMAFKDKSGKNVGFDIDLADAVFKDYGITVNWQPINWAMKEQELKNGNIDLIWNGYSVTPEREKLVAFSEVYMQGGDIILTKKSSNITTLPGMKGKTIGVQSGSSQYTEFNSQPSVLKDIVAGNTISQYANFDEGLMDVKAGRIDGLLVDTVFANYYLEQNNETSDFNQISVTTFEPTPTAVGARKADTELIDKINSGINKLVSNGTFAQISQKWFGKDVFPKK